MAALDPQRLAAAQCSRFGEPCTLPGGAVVQAVFDRSPAVFPWPDGPPLRGVAQGNPEAYLLSADSTGLARGALIQISGSNYRVAEIDPPDAGLVRLVLRADPGATA